MVAIAKRDTEASHLPRLRFLEQVLVSYKCGGCERVIEILVGPWPDSIPVPEDSVPTVGALRCRCGTITRAIDVVPIGPGVEVLE
jgi:hypothetical protein